MYIDTFSFFRPSCSVRGAFKFRLLDLARELLNNINKRTILISHILRTRSV
jgi:hypothetical protein